jgi:hypothetical protein
MIDNKKTVFTSATGKFTIVRIQSYGFRCNTLSSEWEVMQNGTCIGNFLRLKDAKKFFQSNLSTVKGA